MDLSTLRDWYQENRRELPWRKPETDPWGILVSEVMLQQTPVARVAPAWEAWMARWPSADELADASLADVVRQWNRLGYPRRAKNLHACAQEIVSRHGGDVPQDLESLLSLPGIGDYTARAISCFAFGHPVPVVDTNVKRVVARAVDGDAGAGRWSVKSGLEKVHRVVEPEVSAEDYCLTQRALMELGALVCTARSPRCAICPLAASCLWMQRGFPTDPASLPRRQARYEGSDRQARGVLLRALREESRALERDALLDLWKPRAQISRALESLVDEGFLVEVESASGLSYRLMGEADPDE